MTHPVLIADQWTPADASGSFNAFNPATGQELTEKYPVSKWADLDRMLDTAATASRELRKVEAEKIAAFLELFADRLDANAESICTVASEETALPFTPRLKDGELPRTTGQLRQAAAAARSGSWSMPTIDTKNNIRSVLGPVGPVLCIGPNNFPLAFSGICGGDFAAAIATGNPVIAKAHSAHPTTSRMIAELALAASRETGLPSGTVQMFYRCDPNDGLRMVADPRLGACGFTGSRHAGVKLKEAADRVGKPVYLEMSSINPVVFLPGAIAERAEALAAEFTGSCTMGAGQFCTSPGLVIVIDSPATKSFVADVAGKMKSAAAGTLLTRGVQESLVEGIGQVVAAGAQLLAGGKAVPGPRVAVENTLLSVSGSAFLANPVQFQTEMFGAASLFVIADSLDQMVQVIAHLEGNLTGSIYWSQQGADGASIGPVTAALRPKVGRLLHDKMPTGVAVSPAMNHGGPFPATGHPHFTSVGIPASLPRFGVLECYDNVREPQLPASLKNKNPTGKMWRLVDGDWTQGDV